MRRGCERAAIPSRLGEHGQLSERILPFFEEGTKVSSTTTDVDAIRFDVQKANWRIFLVGSHEIDDRAFALLINQDHGPGRGLFHRYDLGGVESGFGERGEQFFPQFIAADRSDDDHVVPAFDQRYRGARRTPPSLGPCQIPEI